MVDVHPTPIGAKELMLLEKAVFLDAREPAEFAVSHLPTARNIGYEEPDYTVLDDLPKDTLLVIYCSIGYRSAEVGKKIQDMGFEQVMNLYGGIFEWINIGGELVTNDNEPTSAIHPYNAWWGIWLRAGTKRYNP
jgi:rhodanese-related sulfurtransferase